MVSSVSGPAVPRWFWGDEQRSNIDRRDIPKYSAHFSPGSANICNRNGQSTPTDASDGSQSDPSDYPKLGLNETPNGTAPPPRQPRPEGIAEKVELLIGIRLAPVIILAVDDLCLLQEGAACPHHAAPTIAVCTLGAAEGIWLNNGSRMRREFHVRLCFAEVAGC